VALSSEFLKSSTISYTLNNDYPASSPNIESSLYFVCAIFFISIIIIFLFIRFKKGRKNA
jgi:hypothetical protein